MGVESLFFWNTIFRLYFFEFFLGMGLVYIFISCVVFFFMLFFTCSIFFIRGTDDGVLYNIFFLYYIFDCGLDFKY